MPRRYNIGIPKLFCYSGRTEEAVDTVLQFVEAHVDNHAVYSLLSELSNMPPNLHSYRGFLLMNRLDNKESLREIKVSLE